MTAVVLVLVLILGVGVYIAVTNFSQQYAVVPGGSNAGQVACSPTSPTVALGQAVKFNASLAEGQVYYWSAPGGTSSFIISGPLTVSYARTGPKTVSLFYPSGDTWQRTSCMVQVK